MNEHEQRIADLEWALTQALEAWHEWETLDWPERENPGSEHFMMTANDELAQLYVRCWNILHGEDPDTTYKVG